MSTPRNKSFVSSCCIDGARQMLLLMCHALCTVVFHPQNGVRSYVQNESFNRRHHLEDSSFIQHGVTHSKGQPDLNNFCLQVEIL